MTYDYRSREHQLKDVLRELLKFVNFFPLTCDNCSTIIRVYRFSQNVLFRPFDKEAEKEYAEKISSLKSDSCLKAILVYAIKLSNIVLSFFNKKEKKEK